MTMPTLNPIPENLKQWLRTVMAWMVALLLQLIY